MAGGRWCKHQNHKQHFPFKFISLNTGQVKTRVGILINSIILQIEEHGVCELGWRHYGSAPFKRIRAALVLLIMRDAYPDGKQHAAASF